MIFSLVMHVRNDRLNLAHKKQLKNVLQFLIELYKKNVTVSCVGSDLLSEWAYTTEPRVVVTIHVLYTGIPC